MDYNVSTIFEQTEYFNQWIESLSGMYTKFSYNYLNLLK